MPENHSENDEKKEQKQVEEETPMTVTHTLGDLHYVSTAGRMPLKDEKGEIKAQMFYVAYTVTEPETPRPLTFVFNGGPGSSSIWLHMGTCGPKRVKMQDEGWMPAPPYQLVDNDYTWLTETDLVFIDPIGTGYSRAADPEKAKDYWNVEDDVKSVGEFIRLYLTRNGRWSSPLYVAGESYGTTRAAALSDHLLRLGIALNGVILISNAMRFQTLRFDHGNDLPYLVYLPTYAATAWYHGQLPKALQEKALDEVLAEVEAWTAGELPVLLAKGDRLTEKERKATVRKLANYTGLKPQYIDGANLRVHIMRFCSELLRDRKTVVGRLDSRFTVEDATNISEFPQFDPSLVAITPPYTAMFNDYVRRDLGYESDLKYEVLSFDVNQSWEWARGHYEDTSEGLRNAMRMNPYMKVFVGQGYYDLATPHYAAHYTLNTLNLTPAQHENITIHHYAAGHMFYLEVNELAQFTQDVFAFMRR